MKKRILPALTFLFISSGALHAQVNKGNFLLGGSVGFGANETDDYNSSSNLGISPRLGYAIGRNTVVGIFGDFTNNVSKSKTNDVKTKNTGYTVNAYFRRYLPIQNKLGWYAELNGGYMNSKAKTSSEQYINEQKFKGLTIGAVPGFYYQVTPKLLVYANAGGLRYSRTNQEVNGESVKNSNFSVQFLSNFGIGVDFILGKR